jgi:hypothetical protein
MFLTCLAWLNKPARAVSSISLTIENLLPELTADKDVPDWLFNNLHLELDISGQTPVLELQFGTTKLPEPFTGLESVRLLCAVQALQTEQLSCQQGQLELFSSTKGVLDYSANFSIHYVPAEHSLSLTLNDIEVDRGKIDLNFSMLWDGDSAAEWNASINARNINYKSIKRYLKHYLKEEIETLDNVSGSFSFSAQLSGQSIQDKLSLKQLTISGQLKNVAYNQGDNLGDKLGVEFSLSMKPEAQQQLITLKLKKLTGEVFQDPIYLLFDGQEKLSANLAYDTEKQSVSLKEFSLSHPQLLHLTLQGLFELKDSIGTKQMNLSLNIEDLSKLNELYLKNILEGTDYEGLNLEGKVSLEAVLNKNILEVNSNVNDVSIEYNNEITFDKLQAKINWNNAVQNKRPVKESQLSWDKAELSGLPLGNTQWKFKTHHEQLTLTRETKIPVFDGALVINSLQVENFSEDPDLTIDGIIEPVSLALVSSHFNWPLLDGQLAAVIPSTHYNQHQLRMGGAMMLQVFDGTIIIKNLAINEPLSGAAQLTANIDLNQLDLQSLTRTYDFGEIQGRVEGKVRQLQLDAWKPIAFDAYLRTPKKDKNKHRISQQAIDNLSSLGGASAILSRTFLSIFETFGYKKLGLSCRLANGTCEMNGVENKGDAYYIVKGGGIPRIDVMGFQRRVDWDTLLHRLEAIQSANQAVIE